MAAKNSKLYNVLFCPTVHGYTPKANGNEMCAQRLDWSTDVPSVAR
jgi:hypothetical protein